MSVMHYSLSQLFSNSRHVFTFTFEFIKLYQKDFEEVSVCPLFPALKPGLAPILVMEPKGVLEAPPPLRAASATARGGAQQGAPGQGSFPMGAMGNDG